MSWKELQLSILTSQHRTQPPWYVWCEACAFQRDVWSCVGKLQAVGHVPPPWWRWCFEGFMTLALQGVTYLFLIQICEASGCCIVLCVCLLRARSLSWPCFCCSCVSGGSRWQEWCFRQMYYSLGKSWLLDLVSRCEVSIGIGGGTGSCNILC